MSKSRFSILAALLSLLLVILAACNGSTETSGGKDQNQGGSDGVGTIKIGVALATSGPIAKTGQDSLAGHKEAVKEINDSGGVKVGGKNYKFEIVYYDSQGKVESATAAVERLIEKDKVSVIIGASTSTETAAMIPIAERAKIPMITAVAAAPILTDMGAKYFTSAATSTKNAIKGYVDGMKAFGYNKVAFLHFNDEWGTASAKAVLPAFKAAGIDVVYEEAFAPTQHEFGTMLDKVVGSKPDVIFTIAQIESTVNLIKQIREKGIKTPIRDGGGAALEEMVKLLPKDYTDKLVGGSRAGKKDGSEHQTFRATFEKPDEVNSFHYSGRDAIYLLKDAFERAGTVTDENKINEAIRASDFDGLMGKYKFNDKGENSIRGLTGIVLNGKISYYEADEKIPDDILNQFK